MDDFLIDRAKSIEDLQSNAEAKSFVQRDERRSVLSEFLAEPDAITQIVDPKGQIIFAFPISLPLEDAEIKIATQKDENLSGVTQYVNQLLEVLTTESSLSHYPEVVFFR